MKAIFETEYGEFAIELALKAAPITAGYYRDIIAAKGFDGATIFRIVAQDNASLRAENPIEVVQGGLKDSDPQPVAPVRHEPTSETGLSHKKWSVSAARFGPGEVYGSFFICMRDEPQLNCGGRRHPDGLGFAVFAEVISGFDVVEGLFNQREAQEFLERPIAIKQCHLVNAN